MEFKSLFTGSPRSQKLKEIIDENLFTIQELEVKMRELEYTTHCLRFDVGGLQHRVNKLEHDKKALLARIVMRR